MKKLLTLLIIFIAISCGEECKDDEVYNDVLDVCVVDQCTDYNPKYEICKKGCLTDKNSQTYNCLVRKKNIDK
jgi:hypothetical protein